MFLGANIDAVETAGHFGIAPQCAANFHSDHEGTVLNYEVLSDAVRSVRAGMPLAAEWKERIDRDYAERRG